MCAANLTRRLAEGHGIDLLRQRRFYRVYYGFFTLRDCSDRVYCVVQDIAFELQIIGHLGAESVQNSDYRGYRWSGSSWCVSCRLCSSKCGNTCTEDTIWEVVHAR